MTIAFDAYASSGTLAVSPSWTHTPSGTPRAAIVAVYYTAADTIGWTYGGNAMTQVAGPLTQSAGGELTGSRLGIWLLDNCPSGAQTVAMTGGTAQIKGGGSFTVTAGGAVSFVSSANIESTSSANPSTSLALSSLSSFVLEVFTSGQNAVTGITPFSGWTARREDDNGTVTAGVYSYDTIGTSDVTVGLTQTAEDIFLLAAAFTETANDTEVTTTTETLTWTDNNPILAFDVEVTPGLETLTWTDRAATVAFGVEVVSNLETLTWTDNTQTLSFDVEVTSVSEALSWTDNAASIAYDIAVTSSLESLSWTDNAASISFDVEVATSTEGLTWTDLPASVANDVAITTALEALTWTDLAAIVSQGAVVQVATESLSWTDYAASIGIVKKATKGRRKKKRYLIEVDGEYFPVSSPQEAQRIFAQLRELAPESAKKAVKVKPPKVRIRTLRGKKITSQPLQKAVQRTQKVIDHAYRSERVDREISLLVRARIRQLDDEEAILALIL